MAYREDVTGLEIRTAGEAQAREAADVLARAFSRDPVCSWIFPAEGSRTWRLRRLFLTELRHSSLRHGAVELAWTDGRIAGAALWIPPGAWPSAMGPSALPALLSAVGRRLGTAARYESSATRAHPREQPHWYLAYIGVDPSRQGRGVGSALLRSRLENPEEPAGPAYTESSNLRNVPLYERFGFQVTGALDLPEGAPPVPTMWRPA
jgi:ribosomal protein S18 acetylase RimI-like enzyme